MFKKSREEVRAIELEDVAMATNRGSGHNCPACHSSTSNRDLCKDCLDALTADQRAALDDAASKKKLYAYFPYLACVIPVVIFAFAPRTIFFAMVAAGGLVITCIMTRISRRFRHHYRRVLAESVHVLRMFKKEEPSIA